MQTCNPVHRVLGVVTILALLLSSGPVTVVSAPIPPGGAVRRDKDALVDRSRIVEAPQRAPLLTPADSCDSYEVKFVGTVVEITGSGFVYDVQVQQVISGSLPSQVTVYTQWFGGPCQGTVDAGIEIGDQVEVYGLYHVGVNSFVSICESTAYYMLIRALPDFEIPTLAWSIATPKVMEGVQLQVGIRNSGDDYDSSMGDVDVQLRLWGTGIEDEWLWIFPVDIDQLASDHTVEHTVDFLFTSEDIDRFEVCINCDGAESDLSNNCLTNNITVKPPAESWRSCAGMALNAIDTLISMLPVDEVYKGTKEISRIYVMHVIPMTVECREVDSSCMRAVISFLADSAVTVANLLAESTVLVLIELGKALIEQFIHSIECGGYLAFVVQMWNTNARHRNVEVNAVVAQSPVYNVEVNAVVAQSPVYVRVVDSGGRRAGFLDDGSTVTEIPGAEVFEVDGDKAILYPGADTASIELSGTGTGTFSLVVSLSRSDAEVHTVTYSTVSVTSDTTGEIDVASGQYTLALDDDGDGTTDRNIQPTEEIRTHIYWTYLPAAMKDY